VAMLAKIFGIGKKSKKNERDTLNDNETNNGNDQQNNSNEDDDDSTEAKKKTPMGSVRGIHNVPDIPDKKKKKKKKSSDDDNNEEETEIKQVIVARNFEVRGILSRFGVG
jgi:hypothetical protein